MGWKAAVDATFRMHPLRRSTMLGMNSEHRCTTASTSVRTIATSRAGSDR